MKVRLTVLVPAILIASAFAGCLGAESADDAGMPLAQSMLDDPPGSKTKPTGRVVEFDLYLHTMPAHSPYPNVSMEMWAFSLDPDPATATVPGPTLRVAEGDLVRVTFRPLSPSGFHHTIHWHGVHVPWEMDGIPFLTQEPVEPGQEFVYEFLATPSGTMWYHCHVDVQHHLDMGMYGALIIEPQDAKADPPFDREYTLMLDEMDRNHITGTAGQGSNVPQNANPSSYPEWVTRQTEDGINKNPVYQDAARRVIKPRDWYPVTYPAYDVSYNTYMINGVSFPWTENLFIGEGETIRIRFINVGNMMHAMHLHGHHMLVTHKDGILLQSPYWADTVAIAPGERYDVYVRGDNPGVWDFHDHFNIANRNDEIWPGGIMTMLVYESYRHMVDGGGGHGHAHGGSAHSRLHDVGHSRAHNLEIWGRLSGDVYVMRELIP